MSALVSSWQARAPHERRLLAGLAALAVAVLLAAFVWLPLERTRTRLAAELPRLAASTTEMRRQAEEVARVRPLPANTPATLATPASIIASGALTRALPGAQATMADERRIRLQGSDVPYGALLESIAGAQTVHGLRVESARVEALPAAGRVRAEVFLSRP